jgi:hypothetical protein
MSERDLCTEGGSVHTWESTGLDTVQSTKGDVLVSTRRCVRCGKTALKPYGSKRGWAARAT